MTFTERLNRMLELINANAASAVRAIRALEEKVDAMEKRLAELEARR